MPPWISLAGIVATPVLGADTQSRCSFSAEHPLRYAATHLNGAKIQIDGLLNDDAWSDAPWTTSFNDIQGPKFWSQPWFRTQVKMRYDDSFLYVGAYLEETAVWAKLTHRNDVIFNDNDFEIFIDPAGTTHNYKEFEVNALNSTWNLFLNKPYRDGGGENSTRVDPTHGFDMFGKGLQSAVFVKGPINDPNQRLHYWTVEIALPLKELAFNTSVAVPPKDKSWWRINFSRVEWLVQVVNGAYEKIPNLPEENWSWTSQGAIAMHMPEKWGYLQFRKASSADPVPEDPEFPARYLAFAVYYAQKAFFDKNKAYATSLDALRPFITSKDVVSCLKVDYLKVTADGFYAGVSSNGYTAHIRYDSYTYVTRAT
ncbi:hypothetical protein LEN26_008587 [Aphanomyces euteiches]|nr:hypothetical protein AeMF1_001822 [Aphanomyces euteiches]KAH9130376.1 hypothetical protein LEN26_008587 [Aphanomyces euteiches]KAH9190862.1 hypothetical protein AeNC1_007156 [Aphanomyces euteiches]